MFILTFTRNDRFQHKRFDTQFHTGVEGKPPGEIPYSTSYTTEAHFYSKTIYDYKIRINVGVHDDGREPEIHWLEAKGDWSNLYIMNKAGDTIERIKAPNPEGWVESSQP